MRVIDCYLRLSGETAATGHILRAVGNHHIDELGNVDECQDGVVIDSVVEVAGLVEPGARLVWMTQRNQGHPAPKFRVACIRQGKRAHLPFG